VTTAEAEHRDLKPTAATRGRTTRPSARGTCLADRKICLREGGNLALRRLRAFSLITTMNVIPSAHRSTTGTSS
jgi:hypothetical protein